MDILPKKVLKYDDIAFEKVFRSVMGLKGKTFWCHKGQFWVSLEMYIKKVPDVCP